MNEKKRIILFFTIGCIICLLAGFAIGKFTQSRNTGDSGQSLEYSRQMGIATDTIRQTYNGLGEIQTGLAGIRGELNTDVSDIRVFATRLYKIADAVEQMENNISDMRRSSGWFLNNYDNASIDQLENE